MKLLDTCYLIDLLKGDPAAVKVAAGLDGAVMTAVNVYELFFGIEFRSRDREARMIEAESVIEWLDVLPLDFESGRSAARIMADPHKRGESVEAQDVFTAVIGLRHGCKTVLTRNRRHFEKVP